MATLAGRHFNRGQRAFFFALGYLGWFVNAWVFIAATLAVLIVVANRQFGPSAHWALNDEKSWKRQADLFRHHRAGAQRRVPVIPIPLGEALPS